MAQRTHTTPGTTSLAPGVTEEQERFRARRSSRIMRIITAIIVAGLFILYFAIDSQMKADSTSAPTSIVSASSSSAQTSESAGAASSQTSNSSGAASSPTSATRAVGAVEAVTVYHIIDGDTLFVHRADGSNQKVRLVGMDCPESVAEDASRNTAEGKEASDHTKTLVHEDQTVWLSQDVSDTDQYGRLLRYVWLEEPTANPDEAEVQAKMLNAIIVADGYAQAKRYAPDTAYYSLFKDLQKQAASAGKGVSYFWS